MKRNASMIMRILCAKKIPGTGIVNNAYDRNNFTPFPLKIRGELKIVSG